MPPEILNSKNEAEKILHDADQSVRHIRRQAARDVSAVIARAFSALRLIETDARPCD